MIQEYSYMWLEYDSYRCLGHIRQFLWKWFTKITIIKMRHHACFKKKVIKHGSGVASSISGGTIFIYSYSQPLKTINFKNKLIMQNTNIWICPPNYRAGYATEAWFCKNRYTVISSSQTLFLYSFLKIWWFVRGRKWTHKIWNIQNLIRPVLHNLIIYLDVNVSRVNYSRLHVLV
jgi:hypothetical protein